VPASAADTIGLHQVSAYRARLWVNFIHVPLALMAYLATLQLLARTSPIFAVQAAVFLTIWAAGELSGLSKSILALNDGWRSSYAAAAAGAEQGGLSLLMSAWRDIWNALFFVVLCAFALGSLFLGIAFLSSNDRLGRLCAMFTLAGVPLTLLIILGGYFGLDWAKAATDIAYPILQPASPLLLALWLWRETAGGALAISSSIWTGAERQVESC
jgi:hypothetical protein